MSRLLDRATHERLAALALDSEAAYSALEPVFKEWRDKEVEDYQFRALSAAQERCADLGRAIRDLLGSV